MLADAAKLHDDLIQREARLLDDAARCQAPDDAGSHA